MLGNVRCAPFTATVFVSDVCVEILTRSLVMHAMQREHYGFVHILSYGLDSYQRVSRAGPVGKRTLNKPYVMTDLPPV